MAAAARVYTPSERWIVANAYTAGLTMKVLAGLFETNVTTIHRILKEEDVPRRRPGFRPDKSIQLRNKVIRELAKEGRNVSEIARLFSISRQRAHQIATGKEEA